MIPGLEDFDPQNEVLNRDEPGTGLGDAPRAFFMKLSKVTDKCKLVPSQIDNEFRMRHGEGRLTAVMSKHVDDLKLAGMRHIIKEIMTEIQRVFGELKIEWHSFTTWRESHSGQADQGDHPGSDCVRWKSPAHCPCSGAAFQS